MFKGKNKDKISGYILLIFLFIITAVSIFSSIAFATDQDERDAYYHLYLDALDEYYEESCKSESDKKDYEDTKRLMAMCYESTTMTLEAQIYCYGDEVGFFVQYRDMPPCDDEDPTTTCPVSTSKTTTTTTAKKTTTKKRTTTTTTSRKKSKKTTSTRKITTTKKPKKTTSSTKPKKTTTTTTTTTSTTKSYTTKKTTKDKITTAEDKTTCRCKSNNSSNIETNKGTAKTKPMGTELLTNLTTKSNNAEKNNKKIVLFILIIVVIIIFLIIKFRDTSQEKKSK